MNDNEDVKDEVIQEESVEPDISKTSKSILTSIKKLLGISAECTDFDTDIIIHINTVFMVLNQLGVGPTKIFSIEDANDLWSDFITEKDDLEAIKTYIHLKVRLIFDPPLSTAVLEAMKQHINELEWRLNVHAESSKGEE